MAVIDRHVPLQKGTPKKLGRIANWPTAIVALGFLLTVAWAVAVVWFLLYLLRVV